MAGSPVQVDLSPAGGRLRRFRAVAWTFLSLVVAATVSDQVLASDAVWSLSIPAAAGATAAALTVLAALWADGQRLHRVGAGLLLTLAVSWAPAVAVASWSPEGAESILVGSWSLLPAALLVTTAEWASPRPRAVGLVAGPAVLAAVAVAATYRSLDDPGCTWRCGAGAAPFAGWAGASAVVAVSALLVATAAVAAAWWTTSHRRAMPTSVYGGVVAGLAVVLVLCGIRVTSWGLTAGPPSRAGWLLVPSAAAAAGVLWFAAATVLARRRLRSLAARLENLPHGERSARESVLHFALPGSRGWVDQDGRPVVVDPDAASLLVHDTTGAPWVRLVSPDGQRWGAPKGVDVASRWDAAQWLLVENARAAALARADRWEIEESRRDVVAASDAERRRIERDLHDVVQQRLVSAKLHVALGRNRVAGTAAAPLRDAEHHIQVALEGLRQVSHGLFPRTLVTDGLVRALEDLTGERGFQLAVDAVPAEMTIDARTAGYAVVALLTDRLHENQRRAQVRLSTDETSLVVTVVLEGPAREDGEMGLVELEDRVGALGGALRVNRTTARLVVEAVIPCAS